MKLAKLKTVKALDAKVVKLISGGSKNPKTDKKDLLSTSHDSIAFDHFR